MREEFLSTQMQKYKRFDRNVENRSSSLSENYNKLNISFDNALLGNNHSLLRNMTRKEKVTPRGKMLSFAQHQVLIFLPKNYLMLVLTAPNFSKGNLLILFGGSV